MTRIYVYVTISGGQCMPQKISTTTFDDRDLFVETQRLIKQSACKICVPEFQVLCDDLNHLF